MRWLIWLLVLFSGGSALAETPAEVLLEAFEKAEAASHKRSDLTYKVDTASFRHVLTKVQPDRTHLLVTSASGLVQEAIVIGKIIYTRQNDIWTESPVPAQLGVPTNPAAGLQAIFASLTERPRQTVNGREQRVFAGNVRWQAGRNFNEGTVEILIDARRELPTRTIFTGQCGSRACTFTQTMDFSARLTVTAPGDTDSGGSDEIQSPEFSDYPAGSQYQGGSGRPRFQDRDAAYRSFRTRIVNGLRAGVNFAGRYHLLIFGCGGGGCKFVYLLDVPTGKVSDFPLGGENNPYLELSFQSSSRLVVALWVADGRCIREAFALENGAFERLEKKDIGSDQVCYEGFSPTASRADASTESAETIAREFTSRYYSTWSSNNDVALSFMRGAYADLVNFYGKTVTSSVVLEEKRKFTTRWPHRNYTIRDGSMTVECSEEDCEVDAIVDWRAQNVTKDRTSEGSAAISLTVNIARSVVTKESGRVLRTTD